MSAAAGSGQPVGADQTAGAGGDRADDRVPSGEVPTIGESMAETHISPDMRAAVGRLMSRQVSFPVSASDIRRWAIAVYHPEVPPRRFWDAAHAAATPLGTIVAPEEFNPFAWMAAEPPGLPMTAELRNDPDRTETTLGIPGPGLKHQLNGGIEVEYGVPMRPGDVIVAEQRLHGYTERPGRLGLMLFTSTETRWTNQHEELVKRTVVTVIRYGRE